MNAMTLLSGAELTEASAEVPLGAAPAVGPDVTVMPLSASRFAKVVAASSAGCWDSTGYWLESSGLAGLTMSVQVRPPSTAIVEIAV